MTDPAPAGNDCPECEPGTSKMQTPPVVRVPRGVPVSSMGRAGGPIPPRPQPGHQFQQQLPPQPEPPIGSQSVSGVQVPCLNPMAFPDATAREIVLWNLLQRCQIENAALLMVLQSRGIVTATEIERAVAAVSVNVVHEIDASLARAGVRQPGSVPPK